MEPTFVEQLRLEIIKREKELEILKAAMVALTGIQTIDSIAKQAASSNGGRTRKEQLADFLRIHGPSRRKDIIKLSEIPTGTIDASLSDKEIFDRDSSGKWIIKQNS